MNAPDINQPNWGQLTCRCGSERFLSITSIRWHKDGGTQEKREGWRCAKCGEDTLTRELITQLQLRMKERELEELKKNIEQELQATRGGPHAVAGGNAVPLENNEIGKEN